MADDPKPTPFWSTLPGIITASTGLIGAITALLAGLHQMGLIGEPSAKAKAPAADVASEPALSQAAIVPAPQPAQPVAPQPAAAPLPVVEPQPAQPIAKAPAPIVRRKIAPAPVEPTPTAVEPTPAPSSDYILRIVLRGETQTYYITRDNDIVLPNPGGAANKVGKRTRAASPEYKWDITIDRRPYIVDPHGGMYTVQEGGQRVPAGRQLRL